ncbi:MAG: guanine deaminase, partial [Chroococcidiopsidaceae cyanobacterium CP_BM_RX_35]|nr:guanine deaminase [Chroococcidiopsidaceae cyanobacterium CP_BM_RX_35]
MQGTFKAFRGSFLDFVEDPFYIPEDKSVRYIQDGLLVLKDGKVEELGAYENLQSKYVGVPTTSYP